MSDKKISRRNFLRGAAVLLTSTSVEAVARTVQVGDVVMDQYQALTKGRGNTAQPRQQTSVRQTQSQMPPARGEYYPDYDEVHDLLIYSVSLKNQQSGASARHDVIVEHDGRRGTIECPTQGLVANFSLSGKNLGLDNAMRVDPRSILATTRGVATDRDAAAFMQYLLEAGRSVQAAGLDTSHKPDGISAPIRVKGGMLATVTMSGLRVNVFHPEGSDVVTASMSRINPILGNQLDNMSITFHPYDGHNKEVDLTNLATARYNNAVRKRTDATVGMTHPNNLIQHYAAIIRTLAAGVDAVTNAESGYAPGQAPWETGLYTYRNSAGKGMVILDAGGIDPFTHRPYLDTSKSRGMTLRQHWGDLRANLEANEANVGYKPNVLYTPQGKPVPGLSF